jgi:hypothetical protein
VARTLLTAMAEHIFLSSGVSLRKNVSLSVESFAARFSRNVMVSTILFWKYSLVSRILAGLSRRAGLAASSRW